MEFNIYLFQNDILVFFLIKGFFYIKFLGKIIKLKERFILVSISASKI